MLKKIALGILILMAICSLLLVGQIKLATYLYDTKINSALYKISRIAKGVKLRYEPIENAFTKRVGRIYYTIPIKNNSTLGTMGIKSLEGAFDLQVLFGPLKVNGVFKNAQGVGNIDSVIQQFKIDPIAVKGAFNATAISPKVEAIVRSDSFIVPTQGGLCRLGQNAFTFRATSTTDFDIDLASAGLVCEGALIYNNKPNYRLDLTGVNIKFLPRIIDGKPHFESLLVNINNLDFKFSTLYAIGFAPEDKVRDPSLQEAISFNNVSTLITLSQVDNEGMSKLSFDNSGNYYFAFPYIKDNQIQPYYRLDDFKLNASLERISIANLIKAMQEIMQNASHEFSTKKILTSLMSGFSDEITLNIDEFGYTNLGQSFSLNGISTVAFDLSQAKPKLAKLDAKYNISADRTLVDSLAGLEYKKPLNDALKSGQITINGNQYTTTLAINNYSGATLNYIPIKNLISQDDMLYEEEQKAQQAEQARLKAEKEALRQEIEAAQKAQENLPSIIDSHTIVDDN